jgi:hypothetical protein
MSNAAEADTLKLLFQNTNFANMGDATGLRGSTTAGNYFVALHTGAGPGQTGTQSTNEAAYVGYGRVGVARSSAGWTITGSNPTTAENAVAVTFGASTSGPETETFASIGQETSGAGEVYFIVTITSPGGGLIVNPGVQPSFAINALTVTLQ